MVVLLGEMLIIFVLNAWLTINNSLHDARYSLATLAEATGHNLEGPLIFKDDKGAQEALQSLRANSSIVLAEVRNPSNEVLAQYAKEGPERNISALALMLPVNHTLVINQAVVIGDQTLGMLTVKSSLNAVWESLIHHLMQMATVVACALLIAVFLAKRLSAMVVDPIQQIASTARKITRGGDYTLRVNKISEDEVGLLTDEFNSMLVEINQRDHALQESSARLAFALQGANDGLWDWNLETNDIYFSPRWKSMLGYNEDELSNNLDTWASLIDPNMKDAALKQVSEYIEGQALKYEAEFRMQHKAGYWVEILSRAKLATDNEGNLLSPRRLVGTHMDISERKHTEQELRIAATAFNAQEGMIVTNAHNFILRTNLAFTDITGYSAEEVIGKTPQMLSSGCHDAEFYAAMWACINEAGTWQGEIWNRRKNGEGYPGYLIITAVKGSNGIVTNYVGTITDIALRKEAAIKIEQLAFYDPLTQLPNRRLLTDRLNQALAASNRSQRHGALLFIDMDNFKTLNDTLGHDMGDMLLQQVAKRLLGCVREGDTVARLGGDEFVVMLENLNVKSIEATAETKVIGEKVLAALNQSYQLDEHHYRSTSSIGITLFCDHLSPIEELLKHADIAMYESKLAGRNTLRFFNPDMQATINMRATLEEDMHIAVQESQFILYYQPQVDSRNCLLGVEALVRWQHPTRGLVFPQEFIPLAEETGLILQLGRWVLVTACTQLVTWATRSETCQLTISVNVSSRQFHQLDFVDQVLSIIEVTGANPHKLKLELTESLLLDDVEATIAKMTALKSKGVSFSLDYFGTGYSSLSYLKRLPLDQLKIDKSFVQDVLIDPDDAALVRTIVALAQSMNLQVIAEGVETEGQRDFLAKNGCHHYQGYLFGKPVPIDELNIHGYPLLTSVLVKPH